MTVERPLRLAVDLSEERLGRLFDVCGEASDSALGEAVHAVANDMGPGPHRNFGAFAVAVNAELRQLGGGSALTAKRKLLLREGLADRDEEAEPVVKKVHLRTAVADSIRGRFAMGEGQGSRVVEYEPDSQFRDTEQIPLLEQGGIEGFVQREVLPYATDAWYVPKSVKVGYEISFNRYFYKPEPMRTLEKIRADIMGVERETDALLGGLLARQAVPVPAKLRVYIDTSVIGGYEDEAFRGASRQLIERCRRGEVTFVDSTVTLRELLNAPPAVHEVLESISPEHIERINMTGEAETLADEYIGSGALRDKMHDDALHIAAATVVGVDVLVSWNFRQMVNLWRFRKYNEVNRRLGYPPVTIRTPEGVGDGE